MKTPLSQAILDSWSLPEEPKYSLTVQGLLEQERSKGRTVGLIIGMLFFNQGATAETHIEATVMVYGGNGC